MANHNLHKMDSTTEQKTVTRFRNCRVLRKVRDKSELVLGDVWVENGHIIDPMTLFFQAKKSPDIVYECHGLIASPGFIDLQVNGALGWDFSSFPDTSQVDKGLAEVSHVLLSHGVTAYCPTIVTSSHQYYDKVLPLMKKREGGLHGAAILGVHAEGPFINRLKKGAHKEEHVMDTSVTQDTVLDIYGSLDNIKIITLAPELPNCLDTINWLTQKEIIVSLGHSMSNLQTAVKAMNKGASLITHLFNAMLPFHHRDPGIVGLLTSLEVTDQVYYGLISDGHHTHETVQRIAHQANSDGVVLVTDALPLMCVESPSGHYRLGEIEIEIRKETTKEKRKGGEMVEINKAGAFVAGTKDLAGGINSMIECVQSFQGATGMFVRTACGVAAALEAASLHPAQVLKLEDKKGTLEVIGADADIVFLSDASPNQLNVIATVIGGEIVYETPHDTTLKLTRL